MANDPISAKTDSAQPPLYILNKVINTTKGEVYSFDFRLNEDTSSQARVLQFGLIDANETKTPLGLLKSCRFYRVQVFIIFLHAIVRQLCLH